MAETLVAKFRILMTFEELSASHEIVRADSTVDIVIEAQQKLVAVALNGGSAPHRFESAVL
jgi:hypothetical protein